MGRLYTNMVRAAAGVAGLLAVLHAGALLVAQSNDSLPAPYASISENGVHYSGPGRETAYDIPGSTIYIGMLVPTHGPQKADGDAILLAARMAIQDASRAALPGGRHLALAIADESVPPWGILGDEIIHLVMQDQVIAIVTSADGVAAHLSEQIGNKMGVATLTLSADDTATEIDMPWIFRIGPSDSQQAQVMARNIYRVHGYRHVLLVSAQDHDGRMASEQYIKEARKFGGPAPISLAINPLQLDTRPLLALIAAKAPQAIVFWTLPENAGKLIRAIRAKGFHTPIYLAQKTAQEGSGFRFPRLTTGTPKESGVIDCYTVESRQIESPSRRSFVRRYEAATGTLPSLVAAEAYDGIRLVAQAIYRAGPNRARVRDAVSAVRNFAGVSGAITFDNQGNNHTKVYLVSLE